MIAFEIFWPLGTPASINLSPVTESQAENPILAVNKYAMVIGIKGKKTILSSILYVPEIRKKKSLISLLKFITPPRTPRISGLKSQILKPTFLS